MVGTRGWSSHLWGWSSCRRDIRVPTALPHVRTQEDTIFHSGWVLLWAKTCVGRERSLGSYHFEPYGPFCPSVYHP